MKTNEMKIDETKIDETKIDEMKREDGFWVIVRGGGDLATGTIHRLWKAGFKVLVLETDLPAAIRRQVSVCEAVFNGQITIEGMTAKKIDTAEERFDVWANHQVPVLVDPTGKSIPKLRPQVVVDAIIAKKNLGTCRDMANLTIALGPGFNAPTDVDAVIETSRGHNLGRIITEGTAKPNTGIPGNIGGYTKERVIHAEASGNLKPVKQIGDFVQAGETIAWIKDIPVKATINGFLRGLIRDDYPVTEGLKIADIDPREGEHINCFTISDKARCIAGSVLELVTAAYLQSVSE